MAWLVVAVVAVASSAIGVYALAQLHLVSLWWRDRPLREVPSPGERCPRVTVQLPLYNEADVAERLLECVGRLDWPRNCLEIQVLDDSTDGTVAIVAEGVSRLREQGVSAVQVRRSDRVGYKAGALREGLREARGELIAIFDADFLPRPDFLRQAVACLGPEVGLVQGRWGHLNRDASAFTRTQAFHLDAHFTLEQHARSHGGLLMGFNGTAGVWRRDCIEQAGGWNIDTLTEDLDLAYRAQLAGWRLDYVDALEAPAELPEEMAAIRAQQHRWMKGGAQVARKLLGPLWRSDQPLRSKLQGTAHLLGSSIFLAVFALAVVNPLILPAMHSGSELAIGIAAATAPLRIAVPTLLLVYLTSCTHRDGRRPGVWRTLTGLPMLLLFCNGLSLHNAVAVLEGWFGGTGEFVRTPKKGDRTVSSYRMSRGGWVRLGEWLLLAWSLAGLFYAVEARVWSSAAWLGFQALGFLAVQKPR